MTYADRLDTDIHTFLARHEQKQLLRFVAVGSVDDGKSTLIGRLLHDTGGVYEDQLADARAGSVDGEVDFARITDGLQAEREQGITIDVAYRYFTTPNRKYIIADTPGHIQYTRNMATGASTANVAIILIDARLGVLQQSRRHAFIASLLGIPHLLVAVNKMDLVDYGEQRYDEICETFRSVTEQLRFHDVTFIPISALKGDNVVEASPKTPWYTGPSVLGFLETVEVARDYNMQVFRYPVQTVIRPDLDYRGFAGQVASGVVKVGDPIRVYPSGKTSRVKAIDTFTGPLDEAFAPQSVTLRLEDEIDISRGDLITHADQAPTLARTFDASVVWLSETPLDPAKSYLIKHTTRYVRTVISAVQWKMDLETMEQTDAAGLELNDIGRLTLTTHQPIAYDPYADNRGMGAFILIDSFTNNTVAAGMIAGAAEPGTYDADAGLRSGVSPRERAQRLGHGAAAIWLTAPASDAFTTLAFALERRLFDLGAVAGVLGVGGATGESAVLQGAQALVNTGAIAICLTEPSDPSARDEASAALGDAFLSFDGAELLGAASLDQAIAHVVGVLRTNGLLGAGA